MEQIYVLQQGVIVEPGNSRYVITAAKQYFSSNVAAGTATAYKYSFLNQKQKQVQIGAVICFNDRYRDGCEIYKIPIAAKSAGIGAVGSAAEQEVSAVVFTAV